MNNPRANIVTSQPLLAAAMMFTGAALVCAIVLKTTLAIMIPCLGLFAAVVFALKWRTSAPKQRERMWSQIKIGTLAGILGTIGYDLSRYLLVHIAAWHMTPFAALPLFGQLLLGNGASPTARLFAGTGYHVANGVAFAIAYTFAFGGRLWLFGVLWALGLEAAMFTLYPGWLDLSAVMREFTIMSILGHVVYGTIIGNVSQRLDKR